MTATAVTAVTAAAATATATATATTATEGGHTEGHLEQQSVLLLKLVRRVGQLGERDGAVAVGTVDAAARLVKRAVVEHHVRVGAGVFFLELNGPRVEVERSGKPELDLL